MTLTRSPAWHFGRPEFAPARQPRVSLRRALLVATAGLPCRSPESLRWGFLPLAALVDFNAMASIGYLTKTLDEAIAAFARIYRHEIQLQEKGNDLYCRHRRRLLRLAPVLGPFPGWLSECSDGYAFWHYISGVSGSYEGRLTHLTETLSQPVRARIEAQASMSPEEYFGLRDWIVEETLGRGGFGTVYKARHAELGWLRAIKLFDPAFYDEGEEPLKRFFREAEILQTVSHPAIVRLFEAGIAGNRPFLVTEFVDGRNLDQILQEIGRFSEPQAARVGVDVLDALAAIHALPVVHRDVKPSNLMLQESTVRLLDFGAGVMSLASTSPRLTTHVQGTPRYVAPELMDDPRLLDQRSDLYSLAVTLGCLVAGRPSENPRSYLPREGISRAFIEILGKGTDPIDERFSSAQEFSEALQEFLRQQR